MCTDFILVAISPEDTLEKGKIFFFTMISTSSMKIQKKGESIVGTFVQHLDAVIVMGKTKVQELKEVIIQSQFLSNIRPTDNCKPLLSKT